MKNSPVNSTFKIGQAAKHLGVSIDTLRRWEKVGKISPVKTPGGTRLYSLDLLQTLINEPIKLEKPLKKTAKWSESEVTEIARGDGERGARHLVPSSERSESRTSNGAASWQDPEPRGVADWSANLSKAFLPKAILASLALTIITTGIITAGYLKAPEITKSFLATGTHSTFQTQTQQGSVLGIQSDAINLLQNITSFILLPFNSLAQKVIQTTSPDKAIELGFAKQQSDIEKLSQELDSLKDSIASVKSELIASLSNITTPTLPSLESTQTTIYIPSFPEDTSSLNLVPNASFESNDKEHLTDGCY